MNPPEQAQRPPGRARRGGHAVWPQVLFAGAILLPCLLAARPPFPSATAPTAATGQSAASPAEMPLCHPGPEDRARLWIDVHACRFELYDACGRIIRDGPCSTGRDSTLHAPDGRRWTFRTPRGARRVHHKAPAPVWYQPDWVYVEAGQPIPLATADARYARGMLGRYALDIGGGYLVHGSPYRIGMGTRSTHGCVRMLDADLEVVYHTLQIGDPVILE